MEEFIPPVWLESFRLNDNVRSQAYENAILEHKAAIKTAIALHFSLESERNPLHSQEEKGAFLLDIDSKAYEVALFVVQGHFDSPAQFISAIIPALLARASVCLIFKYMPSDDILLCLELLGLEQVFIILEDLEEKSLPLDEKNIYKLCRQLQAVYHSFICVNLGKDSIFEDFLLSQGIQHLLYSKNPVILVGNEYDIFKAGYPRALLHLTYADIEDTCDMCIDIASTSCSDIDKVKFPFVELGKGCEWYIESPFRVENFLARRRRFSFAE